MTDPTPTASAAGFSAALAAALGQSLEDAAGDTWQAAEPRPAAEPPALSLHFALTFAGELAGECFVTVPEEDAATLVREGDRGEVLRAALETAGSAAAARIGAQGASVRARSTGELPADARPVASLETSTGERRSLALAFDAQLLSALPLAPATAEASGALEPDQILNGNLGLVMDVELKVTLRFGQRQMPLRDVLELTSGSVVELDRQVDEPVELILEGKVIARGEAVIVDGNYGIRVTEVLQPISA